jgi:hypothetical protein
MKTVALVEREPRICQGDIFKNIAFLEYATESDGIVEISNIEFPNVVVLTQDCDLNQDYEEQKSETKDSHDKKLFSVIVAPLYNAEHVFKGEHLEYLKMSMTIINKNKSPGLNIMNNKNPRYHYLDFQEGIALPSSIIDFKHYFTVNVECLKENKEEKYICKLAPLFREDLSHRFAFFLSRIGLPEQ